MRGKPNLTGNNQIRRYIGVLQIYLFEYPPVGKFLLNNK